MFAAAWLLFCCSDAWPSFVGAGREDGDGLHLSPEGQAFVGRKLIAHLIAQMELPIAHEASAKERLVADVPELPIELPLGEKMDAADFVGCIDGHRKAAEDGVALRRMLHAMRP